MKTDMEKQDKVHTILASPHVQILVGVFAFTTVILDELFLSMEHGVIVLSLWHLAQNSPTIIDSLERILRTNFRNILKVFRRIKK